MNNRGRGLNTFSFWKGQSGLPCLYTPSIAGGMPMQTIIHRPVPIVMPSLDLGVGDARRTDPPPSRQAVLKPLWKIGKEASCGDKDNTDISLRLAGVMSALRKAGVKLRADRLGVHHSIHHGLNHGCSNNSTTNLAESRQCHSLHEFRQQPGSSSGTIGSAVPKISYW